MILKGLARTYNYTLITAVLGVYKVQGSTQAKIPPSPTHPTIMARRCTLNQISLANPDQVASVTPLLATQYQAVLWRTLRDRATCIAPYSTEISLKRTPGGAASPRPLTWSSLCPSPQLRVPPATQPVSHRTHRGTQSSLPRLMSLPDD